MTALELVFLGTLALTSYRSVPAQTDSSPFVTSTGKRVHADLAAVSRDLLENRACYGDALYIEGYGFKKIDDTMNQRHTNSVDMWVSTLAEEKKVGKRKARVWVVRSPDRKCVPETILKWRMP